MIHDFRTCWIWKAWCNLSYSGMVSVAPVLPAWKPNRVKWFKVFDDFWLFPQICRHWDFILWVISLLRLRPAGKEIYWRSNFCHQGRIGWSFVAFAITVEWPMWEPEKKPKHFYKRDWCGTRAISWNVNNFWSSGHSILVHWREPDPSLARVWCSVAVSFEVLKPSREGL